MLPAAGKGDRLSPVVLIMFPGLRRPPPRTWVVDPPPPPGYYEPFSNVRFQTGTGHRAPREALFSRRKIFLKPSVSACHDRERGWAPCGRLLFWGDTGVQAGDRRDGDVHICIRGPHRRGSRQLREATGAARRGGPCWRPDLRRGPEDTGKVLRDARCGFSTSLALSFLPTCVGMRSGTHMNKLFPKARADASTKKQKKQKKKRKEGRKPNGTGRMPPNTYDPAAKDITDFLNHCHQPPRQ